MKVEIGALVEKEYGQIVKDEVSQIAGVEYVFFATGRSNDLFEQKQFAKNMLRKSRDVICLLERSLKTNFFPGGGEEK